LPRFAVEVELVLVAERRLAVVSEEERLCLDSLCAELLGGCAGGIACERDSIAVDLQSLSVSLDLSGTNGGDSPLI
jgi:hypothetical protein